MIIIFCPVTGETADGEIYMYEPDGGPARVYYDVCNILLHFVGNVHVIIVSKR